MQRAGGSRRRVKTVWLQINTFLNKLKKKKKKNSWVGKQLAHMHTRPLCKKNNSNDYKYLTRQSDAFFKKTLKVGNLKDLELNQTPTAFRREGTGHQRAENDPKVTRVLKK